jgi:hypothetical protein
MSDGAIRSIGNRTSNAELMRDCWRLGYLDGRVLDVTYGQGRFWKTYRPERLTTNDIDVTTDAEWHFDFTELPVIWAGSFDTVVFDPPYKLNGTGGSHPSDKGYGVADSLSVESRMDLIFDGVTEGARVLAPSGHLLVKCQDQVVSGHKVWQTFVIPELAGVECGLRLVDRLHVQSYRPQPAGRRQLHSRGDYSSLLVFKKGKS